MVRFVLKILKGVLMHDAVIMMSDQSRVLIVWICDEAKKNISFLPEVEELQILYRRELHFVNGTQGTRIECPYRKTVPPFTPQSLRNNLKRFLGLTAMVQKVR